MAPWRTAILTSVLLIAACQEPVVSAGRKAMAAAEPQMAERLDGAPAVNEEYGIRAVFPRDSWVCTALSGSHPRGFSARLGGERPECPPLPGAPFDSKIVIWGDYNATFSRTFADLTGPDCPNLHPATPDGRPLALPGLVSVACESRRLDGEIEISVQAFAGTWLENEADPKSAAPYMVYSAYLFTRTATEAADKAAFQKFLDQLVLTPPEGAVPQCFWTRATLFAANGTPSLRLRIQETDRVLGVTSPNGPEAPDELPANARTAIQSRGDIFGTEVAGEWRVCPLRDDIVGAMRPVRVTEARNLSVSTR